MKKRPILDPIDARLPSKRVSFNAQKEESSHQHLIAGTALDPRRAELSRQHVRALNNQFASWVQLQIQNHPDELWEDGVKDYLSHASHTMEKFKDVVDWLRANAVKMGSKATPSSSDTDNLVAIPERHKPAGRLDINNGFAHLGASSSFPNSQGSDLFSTSRGSELFSNSRSSSLSFTSQNTGLFSSSLSSGLSSHSQSSGVSFNSQNTGLFSSSHSLGLFSSSGLFSSPQSSGLFSSSLSSGLFSNSQSSNFASTGTPLFPGSQSSISEKVEASVDIDEGNDLEQPSSPSLKKTEEKGIVIAHEVKCKVYIKTENLADKGWKDIGVGQLSIKCKEGASKATKESKPTIVIRNDVGRILLNALIYPGIKMNIQKNTIASIFHTSVGGGDDGDTAVARMYLLRMKTEEETTKLSTVIKDYAPISTD